MIASQVASSMGSRCRDQSGMVGGNLHDMNFHKSKTQFSGPSAALARKSCSAPTPDLFPTTPGHLICMATRGATRVDDDDDDDGDYDDDDNDVAAAG